MLVLCLRFVRFTLDYWWRALLCSAMSVSSVYVCLCTRVECSMYLWFGLVWCCAGALKVSCTENALTDAKAMAVFPCDIHSNSAIIVECMKCKCCGTKRARGSDRERKHAENVQVFPAHWQKMHPPFFSPTFFTSNFSTGISVDFSLAEFSAFSLCLLVCLFVCAFLFVYIHFSVIKYNSQW